MCARYESATGRDLSGINYYRAFSHWRLAAIGQGVYKRYLVGAMGANRDMNLDVYKLSVQRRAEAALALDFGVDGYGCFGALRSTSPSTAADSSSTFTRPTAGSAMPTTRQGCVMTCASIASGGGRSVLILSVSTPAVSSRSILQRDAVAGRRKLAGHDRNQV